MHLLRRAAILIVMLSVGAAALARPGSAATVIRDTEVEQMIRSITDPIFGAAGLRPEEIKIFLLRDDEINAFVAGGQNLFINTGLLMRTQRPEQLAGVVAHETGHIAGGHLSRLPDAIGQAQATSIIGVILGAAAAIAGAPQLGTAILAGGATVAQSDLLSYSRAQEESADQAAVRFLAREQLPPDGLYEFFGVLENRNLRITPEGNPFLRSHPLTVDRMRFIEQEVARSPYKGHTLPQSIEVAHARSIAKLDGFLSDPQTVIRNTENGDDYAKYARSVALFRVGRIDEAVVLIDELQETWPDDVYLFELKGQILFEGGRPAAAVEPYRQAVSRMPAAPLIRVGLARALLESEDTESAEEAAVHLREAVRLEPTNASAWRALGIAEGRLGNRGSSALALTESAVLVGNKRDAQLYLGRAESVVSVNDPDWLRMQDLGREVAELEDRPG